MPGWNIHLEAGARLAKKLKFSASKRREFLLGCLLPDINNGYVNRVKVTKPHHSTHYAYNQKSSLNFYADHKKAINQKIPIYLGYLFHLYTDGYFNYDFFRTIKHSPLGEGKDHDAKLKIKNHDFWIYDLNFRHCLGIKSLSEAKALATAANQISAIEIIPEDILDVERILAGGELSKNLIQEKYLFYTKDRLDALLDDMIKNFSQDYLGEKNA